MDKTKKKLVKDIVYKFAELSKITDTKMCDNLVEKLLNLDTVILIFHIFQIFHDFRLFLNINLVIDNLLFF